MHTFHFRVIDGPDEVPLGPYGQYLGDFWGMFVAIEDYDPRFIEGHSMPDGNLYKLKDGIFDGNQLLRNQGRYSIKPDDDFQNIRFNLRPERTDQWLDTYVRYDRWYPYHAIVEGIRHYDFRPADSHSKNRAWFFEPYEGSEYGRLWTLPWDSDASWGPNWNEGIDYSKNAIFGGAGKPAYKQKYRNVIREIRDLLWTEEVLFQMIDDLADMVREFSKADRDRWRNAPPEAGYQDFGTLEWKVQDMKNFAFVGWSGSTGPTVPAGGRARHLDNLAAAEGDATNIPVTPTVVSTSPPGFHQDFLAFESSPFNDPQGNHTFAAMKWRIGEITHPTTPGYDPLSPKIYEWTAVWESEELTTFTPEITIPPTVIKVGHRYRVRVRMKDTTERWSHWSPAVEFTAGEPLQSFPHQEYLRITEIMYHPVGDDDLEFIEFMNTGPFILDLTEVKITDGIEFEFSTSDVKELGPMEHVVLVSNRAVFSKSYDDDSILVGGEYSGRLSNGGERLSIDYGMGTPILDFVYDDEWYPSTDGLGHSLVVQNVLSPPENWNFRENWRPSNQIYGSPGREDGEPQGFQIPNDANQDRVVDISDVLVLLLSLFHSSWSLPCGDGTLVDTANVKLLDASNDGEVDLADALHLLNYLFVSGAPPALGTECRRIPGCPDTCFSQ